jgi:hypothetical protein
MTDTITLPRAVVQQALEAWEYINKYGFVLADYEGPMEQAITAFKAALEQPEQEPQCNPHPNAPHGFLRNASHTEGRYVCACEYWQPYEAALEQPEPEQAEPVVPPELEAHFRHLDAQMEQPVRAESVTTPPCKGMNCGAIDGRSHSLECHAEHSAAIAGGRFVPLPRREWRGLTEEEVFHVENNVPDSVISDRQWTVYFARAIEAKLKEKNHE